MMTRCRKFIVVGAERGLILQALIAIHSANKDECMIICADGSALLRFSRRVCRCIDFDFSGKDDDRFVNEVNHFAQATPETILVSTDPKSTRMVARVRDRLGLRIAPAPDVDMLDRLDNKWHFYLFCKEHGLRVPATEYVGNKRRLDYDATAVRLGIPFVIKPVDQAGSEGVRIICNKASYKQYVLDNKDYRHENLIAQCFIPGTDVGLNIMAFHGKVQEIAIQRRHQPQDETAKISFFFNDYLVKVAYKLVQECRYDGVMNIDARIEEKTNKVYLLECNPRVWRSLLASAWCGHNFIEALVDPDLHNQKVRLLIDGTADTFWHPLFRPSLWPYALLDRGHKGRLVRAMMSEVCLLGASIKYKVHLKKTMAVNPGNHQPVIH